MIKITTKTGDKGSTSLFGGRRVSKASPYVELVGELDELQSFLGWCKWGDGSGKARGRGKKLDRYDSVGDRGFADLIDRLQGDVYRMMAIAGFEMKCPKNIRAISEKDVKFLEKKSEKYCAMIAGQMKFIKPGSTEMAARLHIARCVCRRVERRCVECSGAKNTGFILKYLNRLSDLLFVLAYSFEKEIKNC